MLTRLELILAYFLVIPGELISGIDLNQIRAGFAVKFRQ